MTLPRAASCRHAPAMTLVEVVAGLALLASLLVAVLLAKSAYARQSARAVRRIQAVAAADALLSAWHREPGVLPADGSGVVPGDGQFAWRTRVVPNADAEMMGARVVRLEVLDERTGGGDPVLASVEFLVSPESRDSRDARANAQANAPAAGPGGRSRSSKQAGGPGGKRRSTAQPHAPSIHHP